MAQFLAIVLVILLSTLAACGEHDTQPTRMAPDQLVLAFDENAAVAANGEYPTAEPKQICGADDRRFLVELAEGSPLNFKVPKRLADIKASPSEIMVAGSASNVSIGAGDFPFDHTFGSDFNMDVALDAPYAAAAQNSGVGGGDLHVELAEGQLPHNESAPGPATGQEWEQMSARARGPELLDRFKPAVGARVLVMGHWIVDCGHTDFQTELHPITFMANSRVVGGKTVVDAFYNPYRETQLYHPDPAKAVAFDDPTRLTDRNTKPFPAALINSVFRIQDAGTAPYKSIDHLESWALLEANRTSPVAWRVCAPAGSSGARLDVQYHWITRSGVHVEILPDDASSCALVRTTLGAATIAPPTPRVCVTPWDFLNREGGAEAGIENLNLQAELGAFIGPEFKSRLGPAPILNCYDPLSAPTLEAEPSGQRIDVSDDLLLPFYGSISVGRATR